KLRVGRAAADFGIPVLYYIAPQLWAWGAHRTAALRETTRALAVILPFEEEFFWHRGIPATFVGHPLLDRTPAPRRAVARAHTGASPKAPVLGIFPGSRRQEIRRLWPAFRDAARLVRQAVPEIQLVVAGVPGAEYPDGEG